MNAELNHKRVNIRLSSVVESIGPDLAAADEMVIDAAGCAVLPGLHDHHIHLHAAARAAHSLDCSRLVSPDADGLAQALGEASGEGWIRGVLYHESIAGDLDRQGLDAVCSERPVRLQHASGKLWVVNTMGLALLGLHAAPRTVVSDEVLSGVELDGRGLATGRLWRMDAWLREQLADPARPDLGELSRRLASFGITGVTDASFTNSPREQAQYLAAHQRGELLQRVRLMGDDTLSGSFLKIMLDDDELPEQSSLVRRIRRAASVGRGVAFHCVSHVELLVALAALEEVDGVPDVRIEHAGVVRPEVVATLQARGATVVTQPGFLAQRGERLYRQAESADRDCLYPYASLLAAGIPVAASSDAPYGPLNPWAIMAAAVHRRSDAGRVLQPGECVAPEEALRGYLADPGAPGGPAREVVPGSAADLVVLDRPLAAVLQDIGDVQARYTVIDGRLVYDSSANTSAVCSPA